MSIIARVITCDAQFAVFGQSQSCNAVATAECNGVHACELHRASMSAPVDLPYAPDVRRMKPFRMAGGVA